MTVYFAWVGGDPVPAFTLSTIGDVWGGSTKTLGSVWGGELNTTGDLLPGAYWDRGAASIANLRNPAGLIAGQQYTLVGLTGSPIKPLTSGLIGQFGNPLLGNNSAITPNPLALMPPAYTTFTYDGLYGGTISVPNDPYSGQLQKVNPAENAGLKFLSDIGTNKVILYDTSQLTIGDTYFISGSGIADNTTFEFLNNDPINIPVGVGTGNGTTQRVTISIPAITTGSNVELTISRVEDVNIIRNLANTAGLIVGETYQIFGRGLPSNELATFQTDGTLLLSQPATISTKQTFLRIFHGTVYPDGGPFDISYARHDEIPVSIEIEHLEGSAALLTIELQNPHIGLLAPGRNIWCWLSWRDPSTDIVYPVFHGRLIALPTDLRGDKVKFQFIAKPSDFENQQNLIIAGLHNDISYDPVWYTDGIVDATSILEARTDDWHIGRTDLSVSLSDVTTGEDGTLEVAINEHVYADMKMKFGTTPLAAVYVSASITRSQEAYGDIDVTDYITTQFAASVDTRSDLSAVQVSTNTSAPQLSGMVQSYCGDGLLSSWPKPLSNIGGGWTVGLDSTIYESAISGNFSAVVSYSSKWSVGWDANTQEAEESGGPKDATGSWTQTTAEFPLDCYNISMSLRYDAKRDWTEVVSFFLEADTQQIATDSRASVKSFSLSSSLVDEPVDDGGVTPIFDKRSNTYFKTSRGEKSVQWLLAYARAKLIEQARAVDIEFTVQWAKAVIAGISCRWNAVVTDNRIPGGSATGKIVGYKLIMSASEGMRAKIKIGCTIGHGGSVAASIGVGSYAADGYMAPGYQAMIGGTTDIGDGTLTYQSLDNFTVQDDGLNFFNLSADTAIKRFQITGTLADQLTALSQLKTDPSVLGGGFVDAGGFIGVQQPQIPPKPDEVLKNCYTQILMELHPVTGGGFISEFPIDVSTLKIPMTINLEAP